MLNKEQQIAVDHRQGPLLIIAGAGTGKTTILTKRIVNLIENEKLLANEILALTFTEKAAGEMQERVLNEIDDIYAELWISTFHAFCERILREHALDIGLSPNFKILEENQAWMILKDNLDKLHLDYYKPRSNPIKHISEILRHFSRCKDEGIFPEDYLKYSEDKKISMEDFEDPDQEKKRIKELAKAYFAYQKILNDNNYLDFGDLITQTYLLFKERPNILKKYREQFKYILIDEFQDTNWMQYELVKLLANSNNNITVAADDDQSIYRFRGASFSNVMQFVSDFPDLKQVVVIQNYRSTQNILDLAYNFIANNNPNRLEVKVNINKKLKSNEKKKGSIEVFSLKSQDDETFKVAEKIIELKKDLKFSDFAVLLRANNSADAFCREFERQGIPYQFLASKGLYLKPIIVDTISYLNVLNDLYDNHSLYRVISSPVFKIEREELSQLQYEAKKRGITLYQQLKLSSSPIIKKILDLIERHKKEENILKIFLSFMQDSGYLKYILDKEKESLSKAQEEINLIRQFAKKMKRFIETQIDASLSRFVSQIQAEIDAGEYGGLENEYEENDTVKIMTVHGSKGLEFEHVFVCNMVRQRFPSNSRKDPIQLPDDLIKEIIPEGNVHLQEERRLFYVAITRAKIGLYLTWARDYGGKQLKQPSPFLIEAGLLDDIKYEAKRTGEFIKHEIKVTEKIKIPDHFSFTQLAAYQACPWQYKFAHILKLPSLGKSSLTFGKTIHNILYKFGTIYSKGKSDLFGEESKPSIDDLYKMIDNEWVDEWFLDKKDKDEHKKLARKIIKNFYNNLLETEIHDAFLEKKFEIQLDGNKIRGSIDRIDRIDGGVEIVDYKTGKCPKVLTKEKKQQLFLYKIAAERQFGLNVKQMSFYFLEEDKKYTYIPKEKETEKYEQDILNVINKIKSLDFTPNPGFGCTYCDFSKICDFKK